MVPDFINTYSAIITAAKINNNIQLPTHIQICSVI
jgi:hypothetical protein